MIKRGRRVKLVCPYTLHVSGAHDETLPYAQLSQAGEYDWEARIMQEDLDARYMPHLPHLDSVRYSTGNEKDLGHLCEAIGWPRHFRLRGQGYTITSVMAVLT